MLKRKNSATKYPYLERLEQDINEARRKDKKLTPKDISEKIKLRERKKSRRKEMLIRLVECNKEFGRQVRIARPLEPTIEVYARKVSSQKVLNLYSRKRQEMVEKVHSVLAAHWICNGQPKTTEPAHAHLLLEPRGRSEDDVDAQFDVWFCVPDRVDTKKKWQESDVFVLKDERYPPFS
jgi:hypothetical protein